MMKRYGKKMLSLILCLVLLVTALPAVAAQTTLAVDFRGLTARADGTWMNEVLTGRFRVLQGGKQVGILANDGSGWNTLTLSSHEQVILMPEAGYMSEDYQINADGYSVSIAEGRANTAPVMVYANAGLFTVQSPGAGTYVLLDQQGAEMLRFETDASGVYVLPEAFRAGRYTLHCVNAAMEDVVFDLPVYRGLPTQKVTLTVQAAATPVPTAVPTAVPTEVPTPVPTEIPTAEPTAAPTEAPTAEPTAVPTATPTAAPTAAPTSAPTAVPTEVPTAEPTEVPTAVPTEVPTPEPTEVPTPEPTEIPTPVPTEVPTPEPTPVPTEAPTATPVPTPVPTEVPTTGHLVLELLGDSGVQYVLTDGAVVLAAGHAAAGETLRLENIEQGEYLLTLSLPEGVMMSALNGYAMENFGDVQWQVLVTANAENHYQAELTLTGSMSAVLDDCTGGVLTLTGIRNAYQMEVTEAPFTLNHLFPGTYAVALTLPDGLFAGEGWQVDSGYATTFVTITGGCEAALPALEQVIIASVSGRVTDGSGKGIAGMAVTLLNEEDASVAAQATTDADGRWQADQLYEGVYAVLVNVPAGKTATTAMAVIDGSGDVTDANITVSEPAALLVRSFVDANNNGTRGTYEAFLPGIEVVILQVSGGQLLPVAAGLTGDDGYATFESLPAGQYVVHCKVPEGYGFGIKGKEIRATHSIMSISEDVEQQSPVIELKEGDRISAGVGALPLCTVTGAAWIDENGDGIWQDGEGMQSGVLVTLTGEKNGLVYETVTGEDGLFTIDRIRYGSYSMRFTLPEGKMFTRYSAIGGSKRSIITTEGSNIGKDAIILEIGETLDKRYIGVMDTAYITGFCFKDANYNGYYDQGEDPLSGVELTLMRQSNGKTVTKAVSGEDGTFVLSGIRGSTFKLKALLPEGAAYTLVVDDPAGNQFAARPGRREQTLSDIVVEDFGTHSLVIGAVYQGTISGLAYLDDNFSGTYDEGEDIVTGLGVVLQDEDGNKVAECRTSGRGRYTFENLNPGMYRVVLDAKRGYAFTKRGEGNIISNTGDGAGQSDLLRVELGTNEQAMHLGMILPGTVTGRVFADANDNAAWDADEAGLAGTLVSLMSENGAEFSCMVGEDGVFTFDAVMPGRYYLRYELPEGGVFTEVRSGGNTVYGNGSVGAGEWFDFKVGQTVKAPLCGGLTLGAVTGIAYMDSNGNGVQEADEGPLAGVEMTFVPTRSDLAPVTLYSAEDGSFSVTDLRPDTWQLTVTFPEVCVSSRMQGVTLPLRHGEHQQTAVLQVPMGARWMEQTLGGVIPASLGGLVWLDENNDGLRGGSEAACAGEAITIFDEVTGEVFNTLVTDEYGAFYTGGLVPGQYTVAYLLDNKHTAPQAGDTTFQAADGMMVMRGITVAENDHVDGLVLGIVELTTLGGQVWVDLGSRVQALEGAAVALMDAEGDVLASMVTGADGFYRFEGLLPGAYLLGVVVPEGQVAVEPGDIRLSDGTLSSIMQQCEGTNAVSGVIEVAMGQDQTELHIGSVLPGRIGDLCWLDLNGNGLQDSGESGIPGVTIELVRDGLTVASTVTDQYGYYAFEQVYPAEYILRAVWPAEVQPTQQRSDFPAIASVLGADGVSVEIGVGSDQRNYNADMGFALVKKGQYPAGYGEGATQDWTRIGW